MYKQTLFILLIFLLLTCEKYDLNVCTPNTDTPTTTTITSDKAAQLSETICNHLNEHELIGIQVSIRDSLNEDWSIATGSVDLKQRRDIDNDHILRIGSVTKIYTATLILKLIEEGQLSLDQSIAGFFPDQDNISEVSIRHLLNHSSGIVDVFSIPTTFISASNFPGKKWNPNRLAEVCMDKNLNFTPGTQHQYSNTNFILLGLIAEKATGQKVGQLFAEYLLEPLNLDQTYLVPYMDTPPALQNGYVHHFALSLQEWYTNEPDNTAWSTIGFTAGAMASTAQELSAFTFHLFNGDIISEESLSLMTDFSGDNGLGLFKIDVNGRYYWGHEGEISGFEAITVYDPETQVVISICCNTTPFRINDLLDEIDAEL